MSEARRLAALTASGPGGTVDETTPQPTAPASNSVRTRYLNFDIDNSPPRPAHYGGARRHERSRGAPPITSPRHGRRTRPVSPEVGRASGREGGCPAGKISGEPVYLKKTTRN